MILLLNTADLVRMVAVLFIGTMDGKKEFIMPDVLAVNRIEVTLTEREVMDGIQDIGLANTVVTYEAIDLWRKLKFGFRIVFKIA